MINKKRLIKLTRELIRINSENPPGSEAEIARFVQNYLEGFGLKCALYEFAPERPNVICLLKAGSKGKKTILISPHLDTVPAGRGWKCPPFKAIVRDNKIYGRGATDCKCNLAVAMEVLQSLVEDKVRLNTNILFAATSDEETGSGLGLAPLLKKNILKADYALILDSDEFDIVIAQKGLIHFKISVFGRKAHGAYPWKGINAINIASDIVQDLKEYTFNYRKHPLLRPPTINIGTIHGGDKVNMVADWCTVEVDLRYLPGMPHKAVMNSIKKLVGRRVKRFTPPFLSENILRKERAGFTIEIDGQQNPYEISRNHPLVGSLLKFWRRYAPYAKLKGSEGATVITFFKEKKIPAIATGFGSRGMAHINDEYVKIDTLCRGAKALDEFLRKGAL
jgi:acetylornithine deacetylase/succinyl-diaminopimelate desuccinylase family protein